MSLSLVEFQTALESVTTGYGCQLLLTHATNAGDPFTRLYHKHFPVATTANEQPKNTDTMNIQVNLTTDQQILDAINNLAAAISSRNTLIVQGGAGGSTEAACPVEVIRAAQASPAEEAPAPEAPKKRKAATPAPKPVEPEPEPVEPEPEPEIQVPTGPELKARVEPIKGTVYVTKLRDYMDNDLGLKGTGLAVVTDTEALKKIDEKITQLLKAAAAAEDEV